MYSPGQTDWTTLDRLSLVLFLVQNLIQDFVHHIYVIVII